MSYFMARVNFKDYAQWRPVFDEVDPIRRSYGITVERVFRRSDDPHRVVILYRAEDPEKRLGWFESPELRAAAERAGIIGRPETELLDDITSVKK